MTLVEISGCADPLLMPWLDLYETAFPPAERVLASAVLRAVEQGPVHTLLAALDEAGELVGMAWYHTPQPWLASLWYLAVRADRRGRGLGARIYREVLRRLPPTSVAMLFEVEQPELAGAACRGREAPALLRAARRSSPARSQLRAVRRPASPAHSDVGDGPPARPIVCRGGVRAGPQRVGRVAATHRAVVTGEVAMGPGPGLINERGSRRPDAETPCLGVRCCLCAVVTWSWPDPRRASSAAARRRGC
jgi:GNAT superfamily N-acetyltransferase